MPYVPVGVYVNCKFTSTSPGLNESPASRSNFKKLVEINIVTTYCILSQSQGKKRDWGIVRVALRPEQFF